jgi:hypothetical protein
VGSFERVRAVCAGKGEKLIQPILDEITDMERDDGLWEISATGDSFEPSPQQQERRLNDRQLNPNPNPNPRSDDEGLGFNSINDGDVLPKTTAVGMLSETTNRGGYAVDMPVEEACALVVRAFRSAAEREISVGDGLELWIMRKKDIRADAADASSDAADASSDAAVATTAADAAAEAAILVPASLPTSISAEGDEQNPHDVNGDDGSEALTMDSDELLKAALHENGKTASFVIEKRFYNLPKH